MSYRSIFMPTFKLSILSICVEWMGRPIFPSIIPHTCYSHIRLLPLGRVLFTIIHPACHEIKKDAILGFLINIISVDRIPRGSFGVVRLTSHYYWLSETIFRVVHRVWRCARHFFHYIWSEISRSCCGRTNTWAHTLSTKKKFVEYRITLSTTL